MKKCLIADSGSTKTTWRVGEVEVRTEGINPFFLSTSEILEVLSGQLIPHLPHTDFDEVHFYGAGCTPQQSCIVSEALAQLLPGAMVSVQSDMLGAARALCQHKPGIACILGTGANSCYYDGKKIDENVSPLGYILGDEGSGAVLGKLFISALLKNQMPIGLKEKFLEAYHTTPTEIIVSVYGKPKPNTYLASFSPFIAKHLHIPQVYQLVEDAFKLFIIRNVKQYPQHTTEPVHFVGSVAWYYKVPLHSASLKEGITLGKIYKEPMEGLLTYHRIE